MWALVAQGWELIFRVGGVSPRTCILAMLWLKIAREIINPKKDNRDDMEGYAYILHKLEDDNA